MLQLDAGWITKGHIEFEYKKYMLLAYLQSVSKQFDDNKIYPYLGDLITLYHDLVNYTEKKEMVEKSFPKSIARLDFDKFRIEFESLQSRQEHLDIISDIIEYATPRISSKISIAREIHKSVESDIEIHNVGIIPLYSDCGYLLFRQSSTNSTDAYYYEFSIITNHFEQLRGLKTSFLQTYRNTNYSFEEDIKADLIHRHRELPNPATYTITSKNYYPFDETLFPVAKKCFTRHMEIFGA